MGKGKKKAGKKKKLVYKSRNVRGPEVMAPVAIATKQAFKLGGNRTRTTRFSNSEFIGNVVDSVAFDAVKYVVNPGNATTFPWLSVEASKWEQYRFDRLTFRYVTRSGTQTFGSVIFSPEYNVQDPAPASEQQAVDTQDSVEDAVWKDLACRMDPSAMFTTGARKFVRSANVTGDLNLYDAANLFVCTVGGAGGVTIGKLWVDYEIQFFVPQNSPSAGTGAASTISVYTAASDQKIPVGPVIAVLAPTGLYDTLSIGPQVGGYWTPPQGTYLVSVQIVWENGVFALGGYQLCTLAVYKNNLIQAPYTQSQVYIDATTYDRDAMSTECVVSCTGTDLISVGFVNGLGTTCVLASNFTQILFQVV